MALLVAVPVFGHLDTLCIRVWDESRLAINAYEMYENGDLIVTHFYGNPDMWNTKPPLLIWAQAFLMNIVGVNELAIRLPSAMAAFGTCLLLLLFSLRYLRSFWFGFIAILVLLSSSGYVNIHGTRTGDYDAMLTLFTTASGIFFFAFCETNKQKYLYYVFLLTALAVLTKSVSGLLFVPAMAMYSMTQRQFIPLFTNKHFYLGLLSFLSLVLSYYLIRELQNPGYIAAVQENELGGRFLEAVEDHSDGLWFYLRIMVDHQLSGWYLLVPCGLLTGFLIKDKKINRLTLFLMVMIVTFFVIISIAQTKLEWYDMPLFPFLALLIAIFVHYVFQLLENLSWANQTLTVNILPFLFLFLIGITPYGAILNKTYKPQEDEGNQFEKYQYEMTYYLKAAVRGKYDLNHHVLLYDGYSPQNHFYAKLLNEKGVLLAQKDWEALQSQEVVLANQLHVKQYLEGHYDHEILEVNGGIVKYRIHGRKD